MNRLPEHYSVLIRNHPGQISALVNLGGFRVLKPFQALILVGQPLKQERETYPMTQT
jgi:hypothetical protein